MSEEKVTISVKQVDHGVGLPLPEYKTEHAAGLDLIAAIPEGETLVIQPGHRAIVPTGLAIALPPGYEAQVRARSGLAANHGIMVLNGPGTIDADFRSGMGVLLYNSDATTSFEIRRGDRIAQLVIARYGKAEWELVPEGQDLPPTQRGAGGFGSTGR